MNHTMKQNRNHSVKFTEFDSYLFHEGTNYQVYHKMGAHVTNENGVSGVHFALWAPSAKSVALLCARGGWKEDTLPMERGEGGVWELFVPEMEEG